MLIFYDNWCPNCTRFVQIVKKLDWLYCIEEKPLRDILHTNKFPKLDRTVALKQMASYNGKWHYGFTSIYFILIKLPVFWIFIPFLYLLKISAIGQFLYSELALKRKIIPIHCDENSCEIP
ncbi:thiol-disulfide oxidoreductase DCC family protein [Chryseobacterium defluvii]|uniref:Putative DCC family thiol-disulfide oxidoreductase YuxK n=1 Tax=Chryseobacterium defluvii TaxID=160396 RepID=A0A495SCJ9_9FLAO|nr:DCC1-like thiol-disulfide oxidoreductase family protein [Chryseobacterium defluvii]RKS96866.1 putative DCC family thiol-disulfide oxidoreductase YuxK [Chryseobacterium defluvii]